MDGAEVDLDYVFDMDMNDVETVTVLKDASASALCTVPKRPKGLW